MKADAPRKICIRGTGSYAPEEILTNADLERMVDTSDEWITARTGIKERHIAAPQMATSDLATPAARLALESAGLEPADLDLIVIATATPDMVFPSTACVVQSNLGAKNAAAFDLAAACSGFIYSMANARGLLLTGQYRNALVIGAETLTRIVDWEDRQTCVLFGDGAGAVVLTPSEDDRGIEAINIYSDGDLVDLLYQPAGGSRIPITHETIEQRLQYVKMEGREVFKYAVKHMARALTKTMEDAGVTADDLDLIIPHQANLRIIEAVGKRLGFPSEKVFVNVDKYGNTSAASIPIALDEVVRSGRVGPGSTVGVVAFGGGFTWASSIFRL